MPFVGASAKSTATFEKFKKTSLAKTDKCPTPAVDNTIPKRTASHWDDLASMDTTARRSISGAPSSFIGKKNTDDKSLIVSNSSTHAYSYNPLSPNSLSVRLTILKKSLEILISNPQLLVPPVDEMNNGGTRHLGEFIPHNFLNKTASVSRLSSHAAALHAFVSNSKTCSPGSPVMQDYFSPKVGDNYDEQMSNSNFDAFKKTNFRRARSLHSLASQLHTQMKIEDSIIPDPSVRKNRSLSNAANYLPPASNVHLSISEVLDNSFYSNTVEEADTEYLNDELLQFEKNNLEELLDILNSTLNSKTTEDASNLHTFSLFNLNTPLPTNKNNKDEFNNYQDSFSTLNLKKILLDSLAVPFFEQHSLSGESEAAINLLDDDEDFIRRRDSIFEANCDNINGYPCVQDPNKVPDFVRSLHIFTSGKNTFHQAIFTCDLDQPWAFRSANDLACLIFGISNNRMKSLSLLDVLHPASRTFVINKLAPSSDYTVALAGEIVQILQPDQDPDKFPVWASLWAKRKNNMLVCVFEKVPCDCGALILDENYEIKDIPIGKKLFISDNSNDSLNKDNNLPNLESVSKTLYGLIHDQLENKNCFPTDPEKTVLENLIKTIDDRRYFTLNNFTSNVPCAISASKIDNNLKLNIHTLPYQAGLFVVNRLTMRLLGFNKSISKNMFGRHYHELIYQPITAILPNFPSIINFVSHHYPMLSVHKPQNKGLVYTEHFFRKIQAEIDNEPDNFYTSVGVNGLHADGSVIKVDLQLHVMDEKTLLVWITHSRSIIFNEYEENPSQLKILDTNELTKVSSSSNSDSSPFRYKTTGSINIKEALRKNNLSHAIMKEAREDTDSSMAESTITADSSKTDVEIPEIPEILIDENTATNFEALEPALNKKLKFAQMVSKDKSMFVDNSNFKIDENLIKNVILCPTANVSSESLVRESQNDINGVASSALFMNSETSINDFPVPEEQIGRHKHSKKITDFAVLQKMGEGAYSKVAMCYNKTAKYVVIIKMIYKDRILVDTWVKDKKLGTIPSEIQIMATLNKHPHDNIMRMVDFFEDDDYFYLETPVHGESGCIDLFDLIEFRTEMTEEESKLVFKQIVSGLKYLHDNGIVHRDIKDENIIIDSKGYIKIIDFGSATYVRNGPFDVFVGTIDYAAPEVLSGNPYEGKPQDIWAIGILLYTIIYKENPFYNIDEIIEGNVTFENETSVNPNCLNLIKTMLTKSVPKRPKIDAVMNDPWLQI